MDPIIMIIDLLRGKRRAEVLPTLDGALNTPKSSGEGGKDEVRAVMSWSSKPGATVG
jgi:hypothetical protein